MDAKHAERNRHKNIYYYLCEKFDDSSKKFDNKKNSLEPRYIKVTIW